MHLPKFNHIGIFGTTGVGKSTLAELICEIEHVNHGMKIIDLQNNKYVEVCSFMGPNRDKRFLNNMAKYKDLKPRGFPTNIFHPIVAGLPRKLPDAVNLFALPMDFFAHEEVLKVLTNDTLGDATYVALTEDIEKLKKTDSLPALPTKILESIDRKILKTEGLSLGSSSKGVPMYFFFDTTQSASAANRPILKVKNLGIFSSEKFKFCLTDRKIYEMLKDHGTITGFSTRWIDQKYKKIKMAINIYLLMKIRDIAKKSGGNIIIYVREARELFPNPRISDKSMKVLSELAEDMIKDCRKAGVHLILDTQTPWDLPEGVLDQISLKFIFRHDRKESDISDMYMGSPSIDKERRKNIKRLKDFRFYVSSTKVSISENPFIGNIIDYKLSGHLDERQDEVKFIRSMFPEQPMYQTVEYLEALRSDWMQTYYRYSGKFNRRYMQDSEKSSAKSMGITVGDFRILKYVYNSLQENSEKMDFTFKEIQNRAGLAKATCADALDRLHNQGFIKRGKRGVVIILDTCIEFIEHNKNNFKTDMDDFRLPEGNGPPRNNNNKENSFTSNDVRGETPVPHNEDKNSIM